MRRLFVFIVIGAFYLSAVGLSSAQGFFPGMSGVDLPSLSGLFGASDGCGATCAGSINGPTLMIGYLQNRGPVTYSLDAQASTVGGAEKVRKEFPVRGLWLGLTQAIPLGTDLTGMLGGSWLAAAGSRTKGRLPGGPVVEGRSWDTTLQWWTLDAAALYHRNPSFALVGGFRYDSFQTSLSDPYDPINVLTSPSDEAGLTLSHFIPYVGIVVSNGTARAGVIGFPTVLGGIKYTETVGSLFAGRLNGNGTYDGGYFVEFFADAGAEIKGAKLGVFGKYTLLHGRGKVDFEEDFFLPERSFSADYDFSLNRQAWILGGSLTIPFRLPTI